MQRRFEAVRKHRLAGRADTAGTAIDRAVFSHVEALTTFEEIGAGDGIRTHDIQLGKLTLYP